MFLWLRKNDNVSQPKLESVSPVVSDIIRDKKFVSDLMICDISDTSSPTVGEKKIAIFCNKVMKNDIKIRFFRESGNNSVEWEAWGQFKPSNVHHHFAIAFKTPAYKTNDITEPVNVFLQLVRPSDGRKSEPLYFRYVPDYANIDHSMKNKKRKIMEGAAVRQCVQEWERDHIAKTEINVNPNNESSFRCAADALPSVTQPNFISNFPLDEPAESHEPQQKLKQSWHMQPSSTCYTLQPQLQDNISHTQNHQLYHSQIRLTYPNIESDYQPFNHPQPSQYGNLVNISPDVDQQPHANSYIQQQQHEQHLPQPNFYKMFTNPGYGGKNLSSFAPYNPFTNNIEAELGNATTSRYADQFYNISTTVNHQQNLYENNFNVEENIENMSDSFGSLLL